MGIRGEVFSSRATSGNRSYFFNVKENRTGDLFLNIVESKKHGETGFERHQIVVFQEDFHEFLVEFQKASEFMRNNIRQKAPRFGAGPQRRRKRTVRVRRDPNVNADPPIGSDEGSGPNQPADT